MRERRLARYHGLARPRLRLTWNKYNLFNISRYRVRPEAIRKRTFFQQKWAAKAATRAYHGEHVKERKWERMFDRRIKSVVEMDPAYLAKHDGSELAAGRGSGKILSYEQGPKPMTPYMQMAFAPLERRLDIAIFRAMFASSARQARQMCVHGAVKVNGKKMVYPGYLLNPGDMFQVDPEKVLAATGIPKWSAAKREAAEQKREAAKEKKLHQAVAKTNEAIQKADAESNEEPKAEAEQPPPQEPEPVDEEAAKKEAAEALRNLREKAKDIIERRKTELGGARKKAIRGLMEDAKLTINKANRKDMTSKDLARVAKELTDQLFDLNLTKDMARKIQEERAAAKKEAEANPFQQPTLPKTNLESEKSALQAQLENEDPQRAAAMLVKWERQRFAQLLRQELSQSAKDEKKFIDKSVFTEEDRKKAPYDLPWRPRSFMAPFVFIPRYLEVNQKICAAVYLRDPVARKGRAEVPTPFPQFINQLAYNWYLRRG